MTNPARLYLPALVLLIVQLVANSSAQVCLLAPFITSMYMLGEKPPTSNVSGSGGANLTTQSYTLGAILNYETPIVLENFLVLTSQPKNQPATYSIDLNQLQVKLDWDQSIDGIYYMQEKFEQNLPPVSFSKSDYYKALKGHLSHKKALFPANALISPKDLVADCSPAYIYEADSVRYLEHRQGYVMDKYKKNLACVKLFAKAPRDLVNDFIKETRLDFVHRSVSSAAYLSPFRLRLTSDSGIDLFKITEDDKVRVVTPIVNLQYNYLYDRSPLLENFTAPTSSNWRPGHPCSQVLENLKPKLSQTTKEDLLLMYPIRTITKMNPDSYRIQINSDFKVNRGVELRRDADRGIRVLSALDDLLDERYDSISVINVPGKPNTKNFLATYIQTVNISDSDPSRGFMHKSMLIKGKLNATTFKVIKGSDYSYIAAGGKFIVPDDIAHWENCKKVVSVYGFLYSLHNYEENILEDPGKWNIFDQNLFDYPIEAMTIEGNEILFLTKSYTLMVMSIAAGNCNELLLSNKQTLHYRQIFDRNLKLDQSMLESRYYDGYKWTPSLWNDRRGTPVHVYIILGFIVALTVVALVVGTIYYWAVKSSQRHVIFSKSNRSRLSGKSSGAASKTAKSLGAKSSRTTKSSKSPKSPMRAEASSMPLFSEFKSDVTDNRATSPTRSPTGLKSKSKTRKSPHSPQRH